MSDDRIEIRREELFDAEVEKSLARERSLRQRIVRDPPPVSPLRRLLLNSLVYLPLAAALGGITSWLILEPHIQDWPVVGGDVVLINLDPLVGVPSSTSITVENKEVYAVPGLTRLEAGASGEDPYPSIAAIETGDVVEVTGIALDDNRIAAAAIRRASRAHAEQTGVHVSTGNGWGMWLFFPLTATLMAFLILFVEGLTTRNWVRMLERCLLGSFLAMVFSVLAFVPAGVFLTIGQKALAAADDGTKLIITVKDIPSVWFILFAACRSAGWACIGAATGLGMNLVRSTRVQLRNSVVGGALGGALGGLFFDPIDRFVPRSMFGGGEASRLAGVIAVGLCIGVFLALIERLAREAWLRVRTGPLAGKSFVLYKTPTTLGSAPGADIYLYKDAEIDATHAAIHRVGNVWEVEDLDSRMGTTVAGQRVRRRRLGSGDQLVLGGTILEFEERKVREP